MCKERYERFRRALENFNRTWTTEEEREMSKVLGDTPHGENVLRLGPADLEENSRSMNDDIRYKGVILRPTGEFRAPRLGEYFLTPKDMQVVGPVQGTTRIFNTREVGFNRVILGIIKDCSFNEELLFQVMLGERRVTIRCNSCSCKGVIGNVYHSRAGTFYHTVQFFHTGSSEPIAYYDLSDAEMKWANEFDPEDVEVINVSGPRHWAEGEDDNG